MRIIASEYQSKQFSNDSVFISTFKKIWSVLGPLFVWYFHITFSWQPESYFNEMNKIYIFMLSIFDIHYLPEKYNWALQCSSKIECCMSITLASSTFTKVHNDTPPIFCPLESICWTNSWKSVPIWGKVRVCIITLLSP